jgi:hypothetical protein
VNSPAASSKRREDHVGLDELVVRQRLAARFDERDHLCEQRTELLLVARLDSRDGRVVQFVQALGVPVRQLELALSRDSDDH